ncbi:MAG TPA: hypothetical protein VN893_24275 [Bryobacteraceae bacterium]|nr:hypothetical protein [Bryobacteraceae bacterium]
MKTLFSKMQAISTGDKKKPVTSGTVLHRSPDMRKTLAMDPLNRSPEG